MKRRLFLIVGNRATSLTTLNHNPQINDCILTKNNNYGVFLTKQSIYFIKKLFAKRKKH